jgi:hypothetical protein
MTYQHRQPSISAYIKGCHCDECKAKMRPRSRQRRADARRAAGASIECPHCEEVFPTLRGRDTHVGLLHKVTA